MRRVSFARLQLMISVVASNAAWWVLGEPVTIKAGDVAFVPGGVRADRRLPVVPLPSSGVSSGTLARRGSQVGI